MPEGIILGDSIKRYKLGIVEDKSGKRLYTAINPTYSLVDAVGFAFFYSLLTEEKNFGKSNPIVIYSNYKIGHDCNSCILVPVNSLKIVQIEKESDLEDLLAMHQEIGKRLILPEIFGKSGSKQDILQLFNAYKEELIKVRNPHLCRFDNWN